VQLHAGFGIPIRQAAVPDEIDPPTTVASG
jgi:hypothetical protein